MLEAAADPESRCRATDDDKKPGTGASFVLGHDGVDPEVGRSGAGADHGKGDSADALESFAFVLDGRGGFRAYAEGRLGDWKEPVEGRSRSASRVDGAVAVAVGSHEEDGDGAVEVTGFVAFCRALAEEERAWSVGLASREAALPELGAIVIVCVDRQEES